MTNSKPKIAVLGAGILGLSTAYELALRGCEVVVVDRVAEAGVLSSSSSGGRTPLGASEINAGMIVPSHFIPLAAPGVIQLGLKMMLSQKSPLRISPSLRPDYLRWLALFSKSCTAKNVAANRRLLRDLHIASRQRYIDWKSEIGGFHVTENGLFMLCRSEKLLEEEKHGAEEAHELGLRAEVLDPEEIRRREPELDLNVIGGVHHLDDAHFDPIALMTALAAKLRSMGVSFVLGSPLAKFEAAGSRVSGLALANGSIVGCDAVAVCAGAWTGEVLRQIHIRLPLVEGKGYSLTVGRAPEGAGGIRQRMRACAILMEARVAVTPMDAGLRFAGTMEIAPPEPGPDLLISRTRVQGILESITPFMPAFSESVTGGETVSAGLRPLPPDGIPYIGPLKGWDNLYVAAGHGMMGMSLGPVSGRLLSQSMLDGEFTESNVSGTENLDPNRFG